MQVEVHHKAVVHLQVKRLVVGTAVVEMEAVVMEQTLALTTVSNQPSPLLTAAPREATALAAEYPGSPAETVAPYLTRFWWRFPICRQCKIDGG